MLLAPIFINSSCNAKLTVGYPFQNVFLISRQKKGNVEDHCQQRLCIYKCQLLKLMGNSQYHIKSMSYSDELIEQVISFLFSFRLFCFILFLQSTFFLFVNLFIYFATTIILQCGEKMSRVGKIITGLYLSYPGQAKFQTFPHKTRRAVYMKEKKSWPGQNGNPPCFVTLFRR